MSRIRITGVFVLATLLMWGCKKDLSVAPDKEKENQDTTVVSVPEGWKLVWHDEFDEPEVSPLRWEFEVNGKGGGNNELQYYTARKENCFIDNGMLVIQALKETYTGPDGTRQYTSARLRTRHRGDWLYGRFEIRAKLPYGKGIWPAIWMMPTDERYGGWPSSGEIDIMELLGHEPNKVYGTLHFGGPWPNHQQSGASYRLPSGTFAEDFHVFALEWDTTTIRWYVDDKLYSTKTQDVWYTYAAPRPAPFDQRFYLILNVAVGGNWPGNPDTTTVFPQRMWVDYVRVFQRKTE